MNWIGPLHRRIHVTRTLHALPFAAVGVALARCGWPSFGQIFLMALCVIFGRGVNVSTSRLFDAPADVTNPSADSGLPPAPPTPKPIWAVFAIHAAIGLIFCAWLLNEVAGYLSFVAVLILGLAATLRAKSALGHFLLGLGLACAPLGSWIALRGGAGFPTADVLIFSLGVFFWATGLDVAFSLRPEFRERGTPGAFEGEMLVNAPTALRIAEAIQFLSIPAFAMAVSKSGRAPLAFAGIALALGILLMAYRGVRASDLRSIDDRFLGWNLALGPVIAMAMIASL